MKRLALCLLLATAPAFAAEFGWKCPGGEIGTGRASPCLGGVKLYLDDMNAAQLNAYTKALSAQDRKEEGERKAEAAKLTAQRDAEEAALLRLCGKLDGDPVIGMTEDELEERHRLTRREACPVRLQVGNRVSVRVLQERAVDLVPVLS